MFRKLDLSVYTSSFYTISSDDYVLINGGTSVGSAAHVHIYGAESSIDYIINIFSVTIKDNFGSSKVTFVRKGMKIKAIKVDTSSRSFAYFKPLS